MGLISCTLLSIDVHDADSLTLLPLPVCTFIRVYLRGINITDVFLVYIIKTSIIRYADSAKSRVKFPWLLEIFCYTICTKILYFCWLLNLFPRCISSFQAARSKPRCGVCVSSPPTANALQHNLSSDGRVANSTPC